jgi:general secretion pathway protein I
MNRDQGFTLIEVVVALAIASMSVAALYKLYALGWRGIREAETSQAALTLAESQLASIGVETELIAGTLQGVAPGGLSWSANVEPYESQDLSAPLAPIEGITSANPNRKVPEAYRVRVRVTWGSQSRAADKSLELETVKLKHTP